MKNLEATGAMISQAVSKAKTAAQTYGAVVIAGGNQYLGTALVTGKKVATGANKGVRDVIDGLSGDIKQVMYKVPGLSALLPVIVVSDDYFVVRTLENAKVMASMTARMVGMKLSSLKQ